MAIFGGGIQEEDKAVTFLSGKGHRHWLFTLNRKLNWCGGLKSPISSQLERLRPEGH